MRERGHSHAHRHVVVSHAPRRSEVSLPPRKSAGIELRGDSGVLFFLLLLFFIRLRGRPSKYIHGRIHPIRQSVHSKRVRLRGFIIYSTVLQVGDKDGRDNRHDRELSRRGRRKTWIRL